MNEQKNPYSSKGYRATRDIILPLLGLAEVIATKGRSSGQTALGLSDRLAQREMSWEENQRAQKNDAIQRALREEQSKREAQKFSWEEQSKAIENNYRRAVDEAIKEKDPFKKQQQLYEAGVRFGKINVREPEQKKPENVPQYPEITQEIVDAEKNPIMKILAANAIGGSNEAKETYWKNYKPMYERERPKEPPESIGIVTSETLPDIFKTTKDPALRQLAKLASEGNVEAEKKFIQKYKPAQPDTKIESKKNMITEYMTIGDIVEPKGRFGGLRETLKAKAGMAPEMERLASMSKGIGLSIAVILQGSSDKISNVDQKAGNAFVYSNFDTPAERALKRQTLANMLDDEKTIEQKRNELYESYRKMTGKNPYINIDGNKGLTKSEEEELRQLELLEKTQGR